MASTVDLWTPPEGMESLHVRAWRAFYSQALDVYHVTPAEYRRMYIAQKGRCWGCRKAKGIHPDDPKARGGRRLGIDHSHLTGDPRALVCTGGDRTCNRIIGWCKDNPEMLRRLARIIENPPASVIKVVEAQRQNALREGVTLTEVELDGLAVAFLWPDDE
jgi:hypothetical protein